jgi:hypothetical protein
VQELVKKLGPLSATGAVIDSLTLRAAGNDKQARAVLRQAAERGIPLPFDGKQ